MELQVKDVWSFRNKKAEKKKSSKNWLIYDSVFLVINTAILFLRPSIFSGIAIALFSISAIISISDYIRCKKVLNDIKKNELFMNNKETINEYLGRGNELNNDKSINLVNEDKEDVVNINDVHRMEYENITKLLDDINRDKAFNIDRPKVLALKYVNNKQNNKK